MEWSQRFAPDIGGSCRSVFPGKRDSEGIGASSFQGVVRDAGKSVGAEEVGTGKRDCRGKVGSVLHR